MCRDLIYVRMYMGSVCVVASVYLGLGVCGYMCEQVCMPVGATHSFPHPSDPARRKASGGERTARAAQCIVCSALKV